MTYVSPDDLWEGAWAANDIDSTIAFIYSADGTLNYLYGSTHREIAVRFGYRGTRDSLIQTYLLGRIAEWENDDFGRSTMVSFWNEVPEMYDEMLEPCLQQLERKGFIDSDTLVSIPHIGVVPREETKSLSATPLDQEMQERLKKMQELHLMRPEVKKAAMKELGLAAGSKKNLWQQRAEELDLVKPGHKWWAMASESIGISRR